MENQELINILTKFMNEHVHEKEWFSLKEGAAYVGVSYGTFIKFRLLGLKIAEVEGIKRVSRKEIDTFLENHSF